MDNIPDAPEIQNAERYGMEYVYNYLYCTESAEEDGEEDND